jgi:hypothetical protein
MIKVLVDKLSTKKRQTNSQRYLVERMYIVCGLGNVAEVRRRGHDGCIGRRREKRGERI